MFFGKLRIIHVFGKMRIIHVFGKLRSIPENVSSSCRSLTRNIAVLTCTLIPLESFLCTHSIHVRNGMENLGNFVTYIYIYTILMLEGNDSNVYKNMYRYFF